MINKMEKKSNFLKINSDFNLSKAKLNLSNQTKI